MNTATSSIGWYDANAEDFAERSFGPGMADDHARFLAHMPSAGVVLDAGCGAGRDALAFLRAGRQVVAYDGSAGLARLASRNPGLDVLHMTHADIGWEAEFDGVWACASLLHLPRAELPAAFGHIARALKAGGVFYSSFKERTFREGTDQRFANGRWFTDLTQPILRDLLVGAGLAVIECWRSADNRVGREGEWWVAALAQKPAAA
ncbi:MAG TPA: class I SAM-dependent methyltransferase [Caulobacteraceae bacterium]|nr:class I SAM-dependent methyltransferase [Caulobacteraceae bacterium]